ncbi:hypothetical protein [Pleomorphomonas sp. T1.2MG-36]|uniref:hypothetical protein n=1 Tax=Pleomorphomonas sp. T1.2MG-36 TaxID=3041167 RepID=UPI0025414CEE|nr:hypothetical protein [Pleomorphomonas sp. T1.2MG-36]
MRLAGVLEHPPAEGKAKMRTAAAARARCEFAAKPDDLPEKKQELTVVEKPVSRENHRISKINVDYLSENPYPMSHRSFLAELWLRRAVQCVLNEPSL